MARSRRQRWARCGVIEVLLVIPWILCAPVMGSEARLSDPVDVDIELFLVDLDGIDDVQQNFVANVYLSASWMAPDLAHEDKQARSAPLDSVWNPRLQIVNQQRVLRTFSDQVEIESSGRVTWRQRFWGSFSQPLALEDFPFDRQNLAIQIVAVGFGREEVNLRPSPLSGVSGDYSIADWTVIGHELGVQSLPLGPAGSELPAVVLKLTAERHRGYYLVKVVLPLILIVIMSMLVFWIDPEQSGTQIGVATTAMLTLIAYRFAVGASLPKLSFLTRLDYFILASTVLVFTSLLTVIWTSRLARSGEIGKAQDIDRRSRWIMPLLFAVLTVETLFFSLFQ